MNDFKKDFDLHKLEVEKAVDEKLRAHDSAGMKLLGFAAIIFALLGYLGLDRIAEHKLDEAGKDKIEQKHAEAKQLVSEISQP